MIKVNDKERTLEKPSYHILIAVRRKKENRDVKEIVCRQIVRDMKTDIAVLKARISFHPGKWRIYHTVNARLHGPASKGLQKRLIDHPEDSYRIDTLYKTFLLKPESKATRYFLIDIDTNDINQFENILDILVKNDVQIFIAKKTPNGFHVVTNKFDTRLISEIKDVSFQRDGYFLLEVVEVKEK